MPSLTRRAFLGAVAGTVASSLTGVKAAPPPVLRVVTRTLDIDGRAAEVLGFSDPLRLTKGEFFDVLLENDLAEPTLIHWHGLTPPFAFDGTPGISQDPLAPGAQSQYRFRLKQAGTYWMHSHIELQRQKLLAAPLIIADPEEEGRDEQEVIVMLNDFTFRDPAEILASLTGGMAGMEHMEHMDHMDHMDHHAMHPHEGMVMDDLNDVVFDAYLANDRTLHDPEVVRVEGGGRVRLRLINGAASTNFWIDLGALQGELIAVDADSVLPIRGRRFELAMAQRLDLRLDLPPGEGVYPILALREGGGERTGIILVAGEAPIKKLDPVTAETAPPLSLDLEEKLQAAAGLVERQTHLAKTIELTGDMMVYNWGFDGVSGMAAPPVMVREGMRVELTLANRTIMSHPMHLHGHRFQTVAIDGKRFAGAMRDTVLVPPNRSVTLAFDADNPGLWPLHCHNLYHMMAGMMSFVNYQGISPRGH